MPTPSRSIRGCLCLGMSNSNTFRTLGVCRRKHVMPVTTRGFSQRATIFQDDIASSSSKGSRPGRLSKEDFKRQYDHGKMLRNKNHLAVGMAWLTEHPALVVSIICPTFCVLLLPAKSPTNTGNVLRGPKIYCRISNNTATINRGASNPSCSWSLRLLRIFWILILLSSLSLRSCLGT